MSVSPLTRAERSAEAEPADRAGTIVPAGGIEAPAPGPAAHRKLCTDCGLSRMKIASACGSACQFIAPDYPAMEKRIHGQTRDEQGGDSLFFGPHRRMLRARMKTPAEGAQWTGITTAIGERLLSTGAVDAVLTVAPDANDRWRPVPVLVTEPEAMRHVRGMRMGYAPLLSLLEPAAQKGYRRIAVIGIACQVHALRAIERSLGFEKIYVVGTPCSDNTTTENFHQFLALLSDRPQTISYLEFRADFHVELRFDNGAKREIPFLKLPIADLPPDFFPLTCRTCVDYTNTLSDITVGYMGGSGEQWLIVRNEIGEELLSLLDGLIETAAPRQSGKRAGSVRGFMENTRRAAGGLPLRRMPDWMRPVMGWLMPRIGPKGLEFARTRVEMKAIETVLHLRRSLPRSMRHMIPPHVWKLVEPYGLAPEPGEKDDSAYP